MKIFFVTPFNTGCSKWRAEIPAKYLRRRGHRVHFFDESRTADCPDVIVFARTYIGDLLPLYRWAKSKNIRVIYDTDDAIDFVEESNPAYAFSRTRLAQARFMMQHADAITTTTEELANHLRTYNSNVVVIPNSIDPEDWTVEPRMKCEEVRIGWAGGNTHYRDVALVMEALSGLRTRRRLKFVVHGLTTMPSVKELYRDRLISQGDAFRTTPHGRAIREFLHKSSDLAYEFHPSVPTGDYIPSLCSLKLDIGVAPLSDTPFNRFKSCIKYYEYVFCGAAAIASNVVPYSEEMTDVCGHSVKAWEEGLGKFLDSDLEAKRRDQRTWILDNRTISKSVVQWEKVLSGTMAAQPMEVVTAAV